MRIRSLIANTKACRQIERSPLIPGVRWTAARRSLILVTGFLARALHSTRSIAGGTIACGARIEKPTRTTEKRVRNRGLARATPLQAPCDIVLEGQAHTWTFAGAGVRGNG